MKQLYISEPVDFEEFEVNLCSGTYLWIDENHIIYNEERHNIFDDIDIEELMESMIIEIIEV